MIPLLQLYTLSKCQNIMNWTVHEYKCLFLTFVFLQIERESGIQSGYKGEIVQNYLSYFSMGFHWRIFLLSQANRLYSFFFFFLHWLEPGVPRVSDILLSSTRNTGYGSSARYEPCSKTNFLIYFRWGEGVPTSFLGSQPIIWLHSSPPWCPATWGYLVRTPVDIPSVTYILP